MQFFQKILWLFGKSEKMRLRFFWECSALFHQVRISLKILFNIWTLLLLNGGSEIIQPPNFDCAGLPICILS